MTTNRRTNHARVAIALLLFIGLMITPYTVAAQNPTLPSTMVPRSPSVDAPGEFDLGAAGGV